MPRSLSAPAGTVQECLTSPLTVDIYTDGACSGNPGPGGWGAVLRYGGHQRELYGGEAEPTTNNRMELTAAIEALEALTRPLRWCGCTRTARTCAAASRPGCHAGGATAG